ncbi:MAG: hypothetical protein FWH51_04670 [Dehalococcoidia bacterium]|nr:hypothetical protein [Dehalococcoidia bacterium]
MSKGARMQPAILKLIYSEALRQREKNRTALASELQDRIRLMGAAVPQEETIIKLISRVRSQVEDEFDRPWTLAASLQYNFPVEATPALLRAFRLTQALNKPFTIRQAKWAAYLSTTITNSYELVAWSGKYADTEKAYRPIDSCLSTEDVDTALTMNFWEAAISYVLGKALYIISWNDRALLWGPDSNEAASPDSIEAAKMAEQNALDILEAYQSEEGRKWIEDKRQEVLVPMEKISKQAASYWTYAHLMTALSEGPKWRKMSKEDAIQIIMDLHVWVWEEIPDLHKAFNELMTTLKQPELSDLLALWPYHLPFLPEKLVKKVGFTGEAPETTPGRWAELLKRWEKMNKKNKGAK